MNTKNRNTGGRPAKNTAEKLKYKVTVKLATAEFYALKAKARTAGINRSEYVRSCLRDSKVKPRLTIEQTTGLRQLCGMANNLNQLARKANRDGYPSAAIECDQLASNIDQLMKQIRNDGKDC